MPQTVLVFGVFLGFFSEMAKQMSSFCGREHRESKKLSGACDAMRREVNFCFLIHSHMSSDVCG